MISKQELCRKIEEIVPRAGKCGTDFDVNYDDELRVWAVDIHKGSHKLRTYLELTEADSCVEENACIPLGVQIAELKRNFDLPSCADS